MAVGKRQTANLVPTPTSPAARTSYCNSGSFQKPGINKWGWTPLVAGRKQKEWQDTDTDISLIGPPGPLLCFPKAT